MRTIPCKVCGKPKPHYCTSCGPDTESPDIYANAEGFCSYVCLLTTDTLPFEIYKRRSEDENGMGDLLELIEAAEKVHKSDFD
jgi:hypothetical protein